MDCHLRRGSHFNLVVWLSNDIVNQPKPICADASYLSKKKNLLCEKLFHAHLKNTVISYHISRSYSDTKIFKPLVFLEKINAEFLLPLSICHYWKIIRPVSAGVSSLCETVSCMHNLFSNTLNIQSDILPYF